MRDSLGLQSREIKIFFGLFLIFGAGLFSYFLPGDLLTLDAHSHLARTWLFGDILTQEHQFPFWTNRWYCGFPLELYYGFLYYLLSALLTNLVGDLVLGTKLFLWGTHVLSGVSFYLLAKHLTSSRPAALFSALFFVFSPQHLLPFVEGGRHPLSLIFLLLPITFFYYEKCQEKQYPLQKAGPALAILLSLSLFTHLQFGIYTLFAFLSVCVPRMILHFSFRETRQLAKYTLQLLALTGIFYLFFTAWLIFPALQDAPYLVQSKSDTFHTLIGTWMPRKAFRNLTLTLWPGQVFFDHIYYVGLLPFLTALFAYYPKRMSIISLSYALAFPPAFVWMLSQTRYTYFSFFLLAVLSAYGMTALLSFFPTKRKLPGHIFTSLLILLLGLDFLPRLRTAPYGIIKNESVASLQTSIGKKGNSGRILSLKKGRGTLWSSLNVIHTNASSPFGGIPQNATLSHAYLAAVSAQASQEVFDKQQLPSPFILDFFRLLNIQAVSIQDRKISIEIPGSRPLWFSTQITPIPSPNNPLEKETWLTVREHYDQRSFDISPLYNYLALMQPDFETGILQTILIQDPQPPVLNRTDLKPAFKIHKSKETHSTVQIEYESNVDGFGWLPYGYFPHLNITLDGQIIPFYKSAMHLLAIPLKKGLHTIQINAGISFERKMLIFLAAVALCFSIIIRLRYHDTNTHS